MQRRAPLSPFNALKLENKGWKLIRERFAVAENAVLLRSPPGIFKEGNQIGHFLHRKLRVEVLFQLQTLLSSYRL